MMIVGSLFACLFTLLNLETDTHCKILNYTEQQKTVDDLPLLYPTSLVPLLNTCLFGDDKDASIPLGIQAQIHSLTALNVSSHNFITASADLTLDESVWNNYVNDQLSIWQLRPSTLSLVNLDGTANFT